jgi:hypothetical protein
MELNKVAAHALALLKEQGLSEKSLRYYAHTGFGNIMRYFQQEGTSHVTEDMLDDFLLVQWKLFEQQKISHWKWRLIRRSIELLKLCVLDNSIALKPLQPWNPLLCRPRQSIWKSTPTAEQLANPKDIFALVWRTNKAILDLGLAVKTVDHYCKDGLAIILRRHYEAKTEQFSEELLEQIVTEKRVEYETGRTARVSYQNLRKAAWWVQEMYTTGSITHGRVSNWGQRELTESFNTLLKDFHMQAENCNSMAETTQGDSIPKFV